MTSKKPGEKGKKTWGGKGETETEETAGKTCPAMKKTTEGRRHIRKSKKKNAGEIVRDRTDRKKIKNWGQGKKKGRFWGRVLEWKRGSQKDN